jgi:DNA-binding transcriptional LysR family regulator
MQFEALKLFCDVARLRSFSRAATANAVTQSAVSQLIRHLEDRLGVQLIDRSTRPLHLTDPGQRYYTQVRGLVDQYLEIESDIRRGHAAPAQHVRIAAIYSVGLRGLNRYVARYGQERPEVDVHIECLHPERVYAKVLDRSVDFGLLSFPRRSRELVALPWRQEEIVAVCAPSHPLARHRSILVARLTGERFVHYDRALAIRKKIDHFLRQHGVRVNVVLEFDDIENIKNAVDAQAGIALLPLPTVERDVKAGTLVAVSLANVALTRPLAIIHRRTPRLSAAAVGFVDLLRASEESAPRPSPRRRGEATTGLRKVM